MDENSVQSISELAEELNIDRTTVIKCLYTKKKNNSLTQQNAAVEYVQININVIRAKYFLPLLR